MKKIRVLYDYQAFQMQRYGGVSRCFMELYKHLPSEIHAEIAVRESDNVYIKDLKGIKPVGFQYNNFICKRYFYGKGRLHKIYDKITHGGYYPNFNQKYSIELLKRGDYDIFHPTFFGDYFLPYLKGKPFVLTIHDMLLENYPQYFPKSNGQIVMKRRLAPLASAIIVVSEHTKKDVVRLLKIPEEKIHVVYHGCSFPKVCCSPLSGVKESSYILYVGERRYYKNFDLFVKNIVPFLRHKPEINVVCTGSPFRQEEIQMLQELNLSDRFIHYWVSSDEEFYLLYHNALCFVYPSEYEGFGIPILEAYQADCPVLLNCASCFPEIAGEAALYFKMQEGSSDLCDKLERLCHMDRQEREALLVKQRQRLALYSWDKSAKQLAKIYAGII